MPHRLLLDHEHCGHAEFLVAGHAAEQMERARFLRCEEQLDRPARFGSRVEGRAVFAGVRRAVFMRDASHRFGMPVELGRRDVVEHVSPR